MAGGIHGITSFLAQVEVDAVIAGNDNLLEKYLPGAPLAVLRPGRRI